MNTLLHHTAMAIKAKVANEQMEMSWQEWSEKFPWFYTFHLITAAENPDNQTILQKAGLCMPDTLRLHYLLTQKKHEIFTQQNAEVLKHYTGVENKTDDALNETDTYRNAGIEDDLKTNEPEIKPGEDILISTEIENKANPHLQPEIIVPREIAVESSMLYPIENVTVESEKTGQPDQETSEASPPEALAFPVTFDFQPMVETASPDDPPGEEEEEMKVESERLAAIAGMLESPVDASAEILLQAFHTIDYFASQGIKADKLASNPSDPLDNQVKSFTAWLKSMKKIHYKPGVVYTDPLVEASAKTSLNKKEIVTEAMAEVWAKQGNFEEAARVYAKLMLLHPEKTPYFAARLQDLKQKQ